MYGKVRETVGHPGQAPAGLSGEELTGQDPEAGRPAEKDPGPGKNKSLPVPAGKQAVVIASLAALALMVIIGAAASQRSRLRAGEGKDLPAVQAGPRLPGLGQTALVQPVPDLLQETAGAARTLRDRVHADLIAEYRERLDRGEGASFIPDTEAKRELWESVRTLRREELQQDPYLILVNKWHTLPEGYEADPVDLPNGQQIGSDCHDQLMQMLEDCASNGGTPIVCSGYRPHWHQVNLFDAQIDRWLYAGYGQEDAEDLAATAVAIPGTSEHELGLAADIYSTENMSLDESQIYTVTQQWLMQNSWKYGFVLRYPPDKSEITGIIFEPWHYRYVGLEHAKKIYDAEICLEEYLDMTDHPEE